MRPKMNLDTIIGSLALVAFLILPLILDPYFVQVFVLILLLCYLSLCWNIVGGYCGQIMLCQGVFFAIGAYTSSMLLIKFGLTPWIGMLVGGIISAIVGFLLGFVFFKYELKSHYFALGTLAVNEVVHVIFVNWDFVESTKGMIIPIREDSLYYFQFGSKVPYYYILLIFIGMVLIIHGYISRSKLGTYFNTIRENEMAADSIGVDIRRYKTIAFVITSFFTSFAGTFYAQYDLYVHPDQAVNLNMSIDSLCAAVLGGRGTVFGPVLGGFIFGSAAEAARVFIGSAYAGSHLIINAIIVGIIVIYLPRGLQPILGRVTESFSKGRKINENMAS